MPTPTSQGSTVTFGGTPIGRLTSFRVTPATAVVEDVTNVGSDVIGAGATARVLREIACTGVEPGGVDITLFGCPPFVSDDTGLEAYLIVTFDGGGFENYAILESFEVTGNVGQFLTGAARFRFMGQLDTD
jgi:hypothetical protein